MNLNEYQKEAKRTLPSGQSTLILACGLCGEIAEASDYVIDAHIGNDYDHSKGMLVELGDVMWYTACMAWTFGAELQDVRDAIEKDTSDLMRSNTGLTLQLAKHAGKAADVIKKAVGHGHPLDRQQVIAHLGECIWYLGVLAARFGWNMADVLRTNVDKLRARYPDGFSTEASMARVDVAS